MNLSESQLNAVVLILLFGIIGLMVIIFEYGYNGGDDE